MCPTPEESSVPAPDPSHADPPSPAPDPAPRCRASSKPKGEILVRHFKIDEMLAPDDRTAYEAMLLDPRQTCDSLTAWLHARGYTHISRGAVHRHRHHFEKDVKEIRKSAKIAGQFAALARAQGGPVSLADASQFRFEQMFLERLFGMRQDDRLDGRQWTEFGRAMTALLDNRKKYETLRLEWQQRAARAAEAVERAAGAGAKKSKPVNGVEIANDVRKQLGAPPVDDPSRGSDLVRRVDEMFGMGPKADDPTAN